MDLLEDNGLSESPAEPRRQAGGVLLTAAIAGLLDQRPTAADPHEGSNIGMSAA
jgi:hypothetical protein